MSKIAFLNQRAGMGDIFFAQKIAYHYQSLGYRIIWPVIPQYAYLGEYLNNFEYPSIDSDFEGKEFYLNNARHTSEIISHGDNLLISLHAQDKGNGVMLAKYEFTGIDWKDWVDYFNFKRNLDKESELFYNKLGLKDGEEYIFVNKYYASPPNPRVKHIPINNPSCKIIEMDFSYTPFEWLKVAEKAKEIHTVETSFGYLLYKAGCKKVNLYAKEEVSIMTTLPIYKNTDWNFYG